MHEVALARSIERIATRAAAGRKVAVIELDVGELRQVVPGTLESCWRLVAEGTALQGSRLAIRRIPGVIECADCGERTTLSEFPIMRCGSCGGIDVSVESGEEFTLTALQLED